MTSLCTTTAWMKSLHGDLPIICRACRQIVSSMARSPIRTGVCTTHTANRVHRMRKTKRLAAVPIVLTLAGYLCMNCDSLTQTLADASQIQTSNLDRQIRDFLQREVTAHVADITTLEKIADLLIEIGSL